MVILILVPDLKCHVVCFVFIADDISRTVIIMYMNVHRNIILKNILQAKND